MTDIQAPYITQMQRNGDCTERQTFYGIGNHPIHDNAVLAGTFERDVYGVMVDLERDKYAVSPQGVVIAECNLSRYLAEQGYEINFE